MTDEASEEKKFLEEIQKELCAIRGDAGEIMKRVRKLKKKVSRYERRHEPTLLN